VRTTAVKSCVIYEDDWNIIYPRKQRRTGFALAFDPFAEHQNLAWIKPMLRKLQILPYSSTQLKPPGK
jgi:hypothetical protein